MQKGLLETEIEEPMEAGNVYRGLADAVTASHPDISAVALTTLVSASTSTLLTQGRTEQVDVDEAAGRLAQLLDEQLLTDLVARPGLSTDEFRAVLIAEGLCPFWPICE